MRAGVVTHAIILSNGIGLRPNQSRSEDDNQRQGIFRELCMYLTGIPVQDEVPAYSLLYRRRRRRRKRRTRGDVGRKHQWVRNFQGRGEVSTHLSVHQHPTLWSSLRMISFIKCQQRPAVFSRLHIWIPH